MERNCLTYDVPAIGNLPFRITNVRIHADQKQTLNVELAEDFMGLYLNLGATFEYAGLKITTGKFKHHQCNFAYIPAGDYTITLYDGLHHSLALQLPLMETMRWSQDIPQIKHFVKGLNAKRSKFLVQEHTYFSWRLQEDLDRLLYAIWKDEHLRTIDFATTSFNIFLKGISEIANITRLPNGNPVNTVDKKIAEAAQYLTDNVGRNISVDELASKFNISQRNLQKKFQEQYGETVHEYILHYRMDQAKFLLMDRTKSIKHIASLLGYKYVENFTTAYRKRFNQSPRDTRT